MKKKIISLLLCTTLVVGACGKYSHAHEERVTPKSAVAISGATATAILTLATYAGFQFKDSNSFDEFLRRMCGMEQSVDFLVSVTSLVGKSIDGTIDFTKELIDDFKFMANRIALSKDVVYKTDSSGNSFAVIDYNTLNTNSKKLAFIRSNPKTLYASNWTGANPGLNTYTYGNRTLALDVQNYGWKGSCTGTIGSSPCFSSSGYGATTPVEYGVAYTPVVWKDVFNNNSIHWGQVEAGTYEDSNGMSYFTASTYYCSKHTIQTETLYEKTLNTQIGDAWSSGKGEVTSNNDSGGVSIKIPSSMDSLLDKSPSDVSTPTYDTWNPGKDISIPSIDNPAIEYTPDTSTDNPGDTDTDNPGDTGTQNPALPDFGPITVPNIDLTPLQLSISSITEKFPFSLPWDIKRIGETFKGNSSVNAPVIEFEFNNHNVKLDFNRFNSIAMIIRGFVYVEFAIGLIYVIRKLKP